MEDRTINVEEAHKPDELICLCFGQISFCVFLPSPFDCIGEFEYMCYTEECVWETVISIFV